MSANLPADVRRHLGLLAAAVLAAYLHALGGGFQFDDWNVIVHTRAVQDWGSWWASMPGIRPLLKLSYTLSWTQGEGQPWAFLLFNLLCHLANTGLVYGIVRQLSAAATSRLNGGTQDTGGLTALTGALIFALHPANTEAVAYISGRSVSLMAFFYLAALAVWLHGRQTGGGGLAWGLSPLLFVAALAVKETAWSLPLLLAWLAFRLPRPEGGRRRWPWPHLVLLGLAVVVVLWLPGYRNLLFHSLGIRSLSENLLTQIGGIGYLISHPLLTLRTNIDPDLPVHLQPGLELLPAALLLAGWAVLAWGFRRRQPLAGFALVWFVLLLLPTNGPMPRLDVANDRQLYLAMVGPAWWLADTLVRLPRSAVPLAVGGLALTLGIATWLRVLDYRDEISLWQATVAVSPDKARAWNNLGYARQLAGQTEAARAAYRRALSLDPGYARAAANLRVLERQRGRGAGPGEDSPAIPPARAGDR